METFKEVAKRFDAQIAGFAGAVSQVLQQMLDERDWTTMDLAFRSGIPINTVYKLLNGERSNPQLDTLLRLAFAFGMEPRSFMQLLEEAVKDGRVYQSTGARNNANGIEWLVANSALSPSPMFALAR